MTKAYAFMEKTLHLYNISLNAKLEEIQKVGAVAVKITYQPFPSREEFHGLITWEAWPNKEQETKQTRNI